MGVMWCGCWFGFWCCCVYFEIRFVLDDLFSCWVVFKFVVERYSVVYFVLGFDRLCVYWVLSYWNGRYVLLFCVCEKMVMGCLVFWLCFKWLRFWCVFDCDNKVLKIVLLFVGFDYSGSVDRFVGYCVWLCVCFVIIWFCWLIL